MDQVVVWIAVSIQFRLMFQVPPGKKQIECLCWWMGRFLFLSVWFRRHYKHHLVPAKQRFKCLYWTETSPIPLKRLKATVNFSCKQVLPFCIAYTVCPCAIELFLQTSYKHLNETFLSITSVSVNQGEKRSDKSFTVSPEETDSYKKWESCTPAAVHILS